MRGLKNISEKVCKISKKRIMKQELHDKAKPVEPKFKYSIGQKVKSIYTDEVLTIKEHCGRFGNDDVYRVEEYEYTWNECELRPYTEPEEGSNHSEKLNSSDEQFERRLNMAKDFAAVLLGRLNYDPFTAHINCYSSDGEVVNPYRHIARIAVSVADALIAEAEKGGEK